MSPFYRWVMYKWRHSKQDDREPKTARLFGGGPGISTQAIGLQIPTMTKPLCEAWSRALAVEEGR